MRKFAKIVSLLLVLSMLVCAFAACGDDDTPAVEESSQSSSSSSSSKKPAETHVVTVKDGLTGAILETTNVPDGRGAASFIGHYEDLHYGYGLNQEKADNDYAAKIVEDTTILLEYTELPIYTVHFQDMNGNLIELDSTFDFKRALTDAEIGTTDNPGLNDLDEPYIFGDGKDLTGSITDEVRNDWKVVPVTGYIQMYEGYSIDFFSLPDAPTILNGDFLRWDIVEGYDANLDGGTVVDDGYFNGSAISSNLVVRAKYIERGTGVIAKEALQELSSTPYQIFSNLLNNLEKRGVEGESDAYINPVEGDGNEKIKYGDEKTYIGHYTDTTFRYAPSPTPYIWTPDKSLQSSDPVVNKFNGTQTNALVHVDVNNYIAFDGTYMYMAVIVRDDTPVYLSDTDKQVMQAKVEAGENVHVAMWQAADVVEFRYSMNINNKYTDLELASEPEIDPDTGLYYNGSITHASTADNAVRALVIDRSGDVAYNGETVNPDVVKQHDFIEIVDLAPDDNTRKTAKITNTAGDDNGYVIGLRFNVQGYIDAINADNNPDNDFSWDTVRGEDTNYFGFVFLIQIDDRQDNVKKSNGQGGYEYCDIFDVSGGVSATAPNTADLQLGLGSIASGVQSDLDMIEIIRLAKQY